MHTPPPWGVTALFTEYTGAHEPIPLAWPSTPPAAPSPSAATDVRPGRYVKSQPAPAPAGATSSAPFATIVDLAKGLNRLDPAALEIASGESTPGIVVDGLAVRKLAGVFWFRSIFPRFSSSWRERLLEALAGSGVIPNHVLSRGRNAVYLAACSQAELEAIAATSAGSGPAGADVQLVLAVMQLWGEDGRDRLKFADTPTPQGTPRRGALFGWGR
jgi:hypothetical protein